MTSPALQDIIALFGCPAAGNPAQYLFERAFVAGGLDARFLTVDVRPERLAEALAGAAAMGFRGCLLSGPLREAALGIIAAPSPAATFAGGMNVIDLRADPAAGDITDGRGIVEAVRCHIDPARSRVLIVGAGPTARAAALEFALARAAGVVIADRDSARAAALVEALRAAAADIDATVLDHTVGGLARHADAVEVPDGIGIVVAADTGSPSAAASGAAEPPMFTGLRADHVVADLALAAVPSAVGRQALGVGACFVDGLEVRAARAAIDFRALTGTEADPDLLREALDEFFSA
jgi:shikimate dehydrogenase